MLSRGPEGEEFGEVDPGGEDDLPACGGKFTDLRFNPCWDSLRGDKRFDKIVAAAMLPADSLARCSLAKAGSVFDVFLPNDF